jgi:predicted dehydrogenase
MKTIGFIDHFIDEWHANNYPTWIRQQGAGAFEVTLAWEEGPVPSGKRDLAAWCAGQRVQPARSLREVVEQCDCLVVLSPDNMERHEALADLPLRSGKPVYVDKTFAPSRAAARRMFNKAARHGTPLFTTSALRYAMELQAALDGKLAGGRVPLAVVDGVHDFRRQYAVHAVEMLVMLMGPGARRVMQVGTAATPEIVVDYGDDRRGVLQFKRAGFKAFAETADGSSLAFDVKQDFWTGPEGFIAHLLRFFATGEAPVPPAETLEVMRLLEVGARAVDRPCTWLRC